MAYSLTASSQIKLADLLKVYSSNSINVAYRNISTLPSFKGSISIDSITKDSIIIGKITNDSILISRIKNKSKIELTIYKKSLFQSIREQANQKLHFNGDYRRGSIEVSRHYYAYSDKADMNIGDLWFIITECRRTDNRKTFYEIELTTFTDE